MDKNWKIIYALIIVLILVISTILISIEYYNQTERDLPEPVSTFNSSYAMFPKDFLTHEFKGSAITLDQLQDSTTYVHLNLLPTKYYVLDCMILDNSTTYMIIYSYEELENYERQTIFSKGAMTLFISTTQEILNMNSPSDESSLNGFVTGIAENSGVSEIFRIESGGHIGYGYIWNTSPWGGNGMTIILDDGTFIWLSVCIQLEWVAAISDNLSVME